MRTFLVDFNDLAFTFSLGLFCLFWAPGEGQSQVIGSLQPILAAPGDDVILPCQLDPPFNVQGLTVEWSKPDLKPDPSDRLSRVEYVHLYRGRHEVVDMKIQSYIKRTQLFTDDLKQGNISLRIFNVTLEDSGRYKCFIPKLRSNVKHSIVELVVDPNYVQTQTTETPLLQTPNPEEGMDVADLPSRSHLVPVVVFCVLVVILGGGGFGVYLMKHNHQKQDNYYRKAATLGK